MVSEFKYNEVFRWTHSFRKDINLFHKGIVLIPINFHNQHWTLAVIHPHARQILYYDSMRSEDTANKYLNIILKYFQEEARTTETPFEANEWSLHIPDVPQQTNCHDCGIYMLLYAYHIAHELPKIDINPRDIPSIRKTIYDSILTGSLSSTNIFTGPQSSESLTTLAPIPITPSKKRKAAIQGSYKEDK